MGEIALLCGDFAALESGDDFGSSGLNELQGSRESSALLDERSCERRESRTESSGVHFTLDPGVRIESYSRIERTHKTPLLRCLREDSPTVWQAKSQKFVVWASWNWGASPSP
jgi:hypothetical protein